MASLSQNGAASSRWDSRNQGFIPPSQLQQWKQQQERVHDFSPSPPPDRQPQPEPRPAVLRKNSTTPAAAPTHHSRSFSAFSMFKARYSHDDTPASPPAGNDSAKSPQIPPITYPERRANIPDSEASAPQPPVNQAALSRITSPDTAPPLHPEIRSTVQLTLAHAHKIYISGPLVKHIERQPDGQKPARDEGWRDVWAQLGGTTLSVWDMKAIEEASKQGKQVPPAYINVTDAFVKVLGSITVVATPGGPPIKYSNVITLNTAGSNLLYFSCSSPQMLVSWATAFRLATWEKSRLEEIYTAHLIRVTLNDGRDYPSSLINGRLEGWVRIRIAGQVDWKRMWMIVSNMHASDGSSISSVDHLPGSPTMPRRKKRISDLFVKDRSPVRAPPPAKPSICLVASPKPRDRRQPLLTMTGVFQAFAVYPERPELINRSTLMKLEGVFGDEDMAGGMKSKEGWLMVLPEFEGQNIRASEMLKWLIGIHDAFELYGRPRQYSWDPRDPRSMMFAYPIGPQRDMLFLDRELAETLDVRDERTAAVRSQLQGILADRMRGADERSLVAEKPPILPPLPDAGAEDPHANARTQLSPGEAEGFKMQLPPLDFGHEDEPPSVPDKRVLTPITERSTSGDPSRSFSVEETVPKVVSAQYNHPPPRIPETTEEDTRIPETIEEDSRVRAGDIPSSPTTTAPPSVTSPPLPPIPVYDRGRRNPSFEVFRPPPKPQHPEPGAKLTPYTDPQTTNTTMQVPTSAKPETRPAVTVSAQVPSSPPTASSQHTQPSDRPVPARSPPVASVSSHQSPRPTSPQVPPKSPSVPSRAPSSHIVTPASIAKALPQTPLTASSKSFSVATPQSTPPAEPPTPPPPQSVSDDFSHAAGALYYMSQMQDEPVQDTRVKPNKLPRPVSKQDDSDSQSEYSQSYTPQSLHTRHASPHSASAERPGTTRRDTANSMASSRSNIAGAPTEAPAIAASTGRSGMGRKPSGARAPPVSKIHTPRNSFAPDQCLHERNNESAHDDNMVDLHDPAPQVARAQHALEDPNADALAALTFLEQGDSDAADTSPSQRRLAASSSASSSTHAVPQVVEPSGSPPKLSRPREYRSSFQPSKQAAERKAKAQAQQAAQHAAVSRPGRVNGKRASGRGGWAESSDEEEEDEEEEEDADSDEEPVPRMASGQRSASGSIAPSHSGSTANFSGRDPSPAAPDVNDSYSGRRPPRELPQVPNPNQLYPGMQVAGQQDDYLSPQPRRFVSDPYSGRQSMIDPPRLSASPQSNYRPQTHMDVPPPMANRQTIWSHTLETHNGTPPPQSGPVRDTFIQMEPPAATMTKAFAPHGLLSAGIQDKQDRSAKRQEELARETGASLINVPHKPPPPQTGLLGAVTAHERERKREGGIGAALTERERDKRLAEDRQRKLDDYQRQQLEQMQQTGSMYGGMGMPGFNPMMGNPMMMGMNPMMTGGWGYPGMMPGFASPQHMMAAQQAAMQAYQQAMIAFSTAGSQIGGDGGAPQLNPMMTGGSMGMGGMGGMDPRMSMMGMPMMSPSMGMNPTMGMGMNSPMGMNPGMGMNPSMNMGLGGMGMSPMGMQMTGDGMAPHTFGGSGMQPVSENSGSGPNSGQNSLLGERRSPAPPGQDSRGRVGAPSPLR